MHRYELCFLQLAVARLQNSDGTFDKELYRESGSKVIFVLQHTESSCTPVRPCIFSLCLLSVRPSVRLPLPFCVCARACVCVRVCVCVCVCVSVDYWYVGLFSILVGSLVVYSLFYAHFFPSPSPNFSGYFLAYHIIIHQLITLP